VLEQVKPEEAFTVHKSDVSHFHIFSSLVYCHVPEEKRKKLEPAIEKGILVGYNETSKVYKVYIPTHRKTIIRRDVKFEEDRALKMSLEHEQVIVQEEEE